MFENYLLTITIFLPLLGSVILLFMNSEKINVIKYTALIFSIMTFIISLFLYFGYDSTKTGFQFLTKIDWIKSLNVSYHIGIDGISLLLILLTTFITPLTLLSSWVSIQRKVKEFLFFFLVLETGMIGVFASLDFFLFYIFWESMLIPMYFIIGIWGGERKIYAAVKFFLYTMFGSLLMLVAIIALGIYGMDHLGYFTTDFLILKNVAPLLTQSVQLLMFLGFALSFAIKVPLFPFHTWLPDAHVEAPTAGSVILAGILLKMGTYGLIRFCLPMFPQVSIDLAPYISIIAIIGIIYGALVAMVQPDMKKLIAYSSVSHLGFVVLGIFAMNIESMQGAMIQMVNHGLSTGALFLLVGMIYDRRHTRLISEYGGIAKKVPVFSTILLFISLSSIGLPMLNGFIGEFLILIGTFKSSVLNSWWFAAFAATGVIFAAVYLLWMYQRVVFGKLENPQNEKLTDLDGREIGLLVPILFFIVWIGVYPSTFLNVSEESVKNILRDVNQIKTELVIKTPEIK
jgi:NADH-quinone oxidoreductase subunit M